MKKKSKKTIDREVIYQRPNLGWMPETYTGGESVTFPNGLILKQGEVEVKANTTVDITYEEAFPNGVKTTQANGKAVSAVAKSGSKKRVLQVTNPGNVKYDVSWQAWGY